MARLLSAPSSGRVLNTRLTSPWLLVCPLILAALAFSSGWGQPLAVDLDGDGDLDLLAPDPAGRRGFAVQSVADVGTLAPKTAAVTTDSPHLAICDWDADGQPDVLVVRRGQPMSLWINVGDNEFSEDEDFARELSFPVESVVVADLSHSSLPGLVCRQDSSTVVRVLRTEYGPLDVTTWSVGDDGPLSVRDYNADGDMDAVVGRRLLFGVSSAWEPSWTSVDSAEETATSKLRLVGTEGNPDAMGSRVVVRTPAGRQTYWNYSPTDGAVDIALPDDCAGIEIVWPDGSHSSIAQPLDRADYVVRASTPRASLETQWTGDDIGTYIRWRVDPPVEDSERGLWRVARSGHVGDPEPVAFDASGRKMEWRASSPLAEGEHAILSYAGRPASMWTRPSVYVEHLTIPIASLSLPDVAQIVVGDGDGDGRLDLILGDLTGRSFSATILPLPEHLPVRSAPSVFNPERMGHEAWWRIVVEAEDVGLATVNGHSDTTAGDGTIVEGESEDPLALDGEPTVVRRVMADLTGDGRLDMLVQSSDRTLEVYQGTDGRPSAMHVAERDIVIGPAGPGDTGTVTIANPTASEMILTGVEATEGLQAPVLTFPAVIPAHDTLAVAILLPSGVREDFDGEVTLVSQDLDSGRVTLPLSVSIGVSPDAPMLEMSLDFGVVQRDTATSRLVTVPWVRLLPDADRPAELSVGTADASVEADSASLDTVGLTVQLSTHAVGQVDLEYPLRRGSIVISATVVDTVAPPAVFATAVLSRDSVTIRWSSIDAADMDHYEVQLLDDESPRTWRVEADSQWTDTGLAEGELRRYTVYAIDVTGNFGPGDTVAVRRPDETPPTVRMESPADEAVEVGVFEPVTIVVRDSVSGISADSFAVWINDRLLSPDDLSIEVEASRWTATYSPDAWLLNETIRIAVAASDTCDPPNSVRWMGTFTTVADTIIPDLLWAGLPPVLTEGTTVTASVAMPEDRALLRASLIVRPAGGDVSETIEGKVLGHEVEFDLPPALCPLSGFFYQWTVETDRRAYEWPDAWRSWAFPLPEDGIFWPRSGEPGPGLSLLSIPVDADQIDALDQIRSDIESGATGARIHRYDSELQLWSDDTERATGIGDAVVLSWDEAAPIVQTGQGRTVVLDSAIEIGLKPRWNLIGQPFPYPVSWQRVRDRNASLSLGWPWVTRDGLEMSDVWDAWEGAWVYLDDTSPATLVVPPGDTVLAYEEADALPQWLPGTDAADDDRSSCLISITASNEARTIRDLTLGWFPDAQDGPDAMDVRAPPSPDSVLVAGFFHTGAEDSSVRYAVDLRERPGEVWRLTVRTMRRSPLLLDFSFVVPPPEGVVASLVDLVTGDSVRITDGMSYRLLDLARFPTREMVILVGDETFRESIETEEVLAPSEFHLYPNYPNPFNGATNISYSIPDRPGESQHVMLAIYNMLGQHVRTLQNTRSSPGVYSVEWNALDDNGQPISSGLYFCEIIWGTERRLQRMIYLR